MVEIEFVNGDKETVETREDEYSPWAYMDDVGCFFVPSIEGDFYPILGRIPPLLSEVKVGDECRFSDVF